MEDGQSSAGAIVPVTAVIPFGGAETANYVGRPMTAEEISTSEMKSGYTTVSVILTDGLCDVNCDPQQLRNKQARGRVRTMVAGVVHGESNALSKRIKYGHWAAFKQRAVQNGDLMTAVNELPVRH